MNKLALSRIIKLVSPELKEVEKTLSRLLEVENPVIREIGDYVCNSGGKRLRPLLLLVSAKMCGYTGDQAPLNASIMEMIHVATLLHDDVLDRAEVRRGRMSANAKWSNNVSVLTGDYLYAWSLFTLEEAKRPAILKLVITAVMKMTDGEILQATSKGDLTITETMYQSIIQKKTADLFACSCQIGALLLPEPRPEYQQALAQYGHAIGMAFQIMDDILDYTADQTRLGKVIGGDVKEKNYTLPIIHAYAQATAQEQEKLTSLFAQDEVPAEGLPYCLELIEQYDSFTYALDKAKQYIADAQECLLVFDDSPYRKAFQTITEFIIQRDH